MLPRIELASPRNLLGIRRILSLEKYAVGELWRSFLPRKKEIQNPLNADLLSVAVYPAGYFDDFSPSREFERWAAVEVADQGQIPQGMESLVLPGGLYAVFAYQGLSGDPSIFQYILGTWLPASAYDLDDRPHFEVLGPKYKNNDPSSEEEIWIPIRAKQGTE